MGFRIAVIVILVAALTGCLNKNTRDRPPEIVRTPILFCPAPPGLDTRVDELDLYINDLTDEDLKDPGKVVQAFRADVYQLMKGRKEDTKVLKKYEDLSKKLDELKDLPEFKALADRLFGSQLPAAAPATNAPPGPAPTN